MLNPIKETVQKQAFDHVKLSVTWSGPAPCEVGDELVTVTGRRYQVMQMKGKRFDCMILPPHATVQSRQWELTWNPRKKKV
jgi:hypothetical protein